MTETVRPGTGDDLAGVLALERERREAAEREVGRLEALVEDLRAGGAGSGEDPPFDPFPAEYAARFIYPDYEEALGAVDWQGAAEAVNRVYPLLAETMEARARGEETPPSLGDLVRWNGTLVKMAFLLRQKGVPGTGNNGPYTHPAVVVNMVHATLTWAGAPLHEAQEEPLEEIGRRFIEEDRQRILGYSDGTLAFRKVVDETGLKDRLIAEIDGILTEQQREILHPPRFRDRLIGDLFSSGIIWATSLEPVEFKNREDFQGCLPRCLLEILDTEEFSEIVETVSARWAAAYPASFFDETMDDLSKDTLLPLSRVRLAASTQLAAFEEVARELPPDSDAMTKLRDFNRLILPVHTE